MCLNCLFFSFILYACEICNNKAKLFKKNKNKNLILMLLVPFCWVLSQHFCSYFNSIPSMNSIKQLSLSKFCCFQFSTSSSYRSCFFFFLDSCNLVKLPFEQSVEWYSRLHLLLLVMVVKRQVKRVGEVYLERSEMVNSVARQVQRRERSGSELETVSVHLSKVPLLY